MKNLKQLLKKKKSMIKLKKIIEWWEVGNSYENNDELSENNRNIREIGRNVYNTFFDMYKVFEISAETFAEDKVYNIIDTEKKLWLKNKTRKLGLQNLYDLFDQETKGTYKTKNPTKQQIK